MTTLSPQSTGGAAVALGSRNPFLGMVTPQSTGPNSNVNAVSATSGTSGTAQANEYSTSASAEADRIANRPSQTTPALIRSGTSHSGALNSSPAQTVTPEPPSRAEDTTPGRRSYNPPPGPPPPSLPPRPRSVDPPYSGRSNTLDILAEDLPPAYTPGPNAREGEQSIEFGPLRPFQNVEPRPAPRPTPNNGIYFGSAPGGRNRIERGGGSLSRLLGDMVISYMNSSLSPPHGTSNSSAPSAQYGTSIPSQPSTRSMPPGRQNWSQYPGQINRSTTPEPQSPPVNDGKPTTRPIPGHPLLSRGRVLIYPPGYECHKCYNKGFRPVHASTFDPTPRALAPGDPSHPCLKCWRTYSHPYNAEIAQLDWNDVVTANRQRPISEALQGQPRNGPPQVSSPGPSMQPQFTGSPPPRSSPFGGPSSPRSRGRGSGFGGGFPGVIVVQTSGRGGSGRTTFTPGDARIGGRRCVKCDGTGRIRVFILESERCNMCGGLGRVF